MTIDWVVVVPTRGTSAAIDRIAHNIAENIGAANLLVVLNAADPAMLDAAEIAAAGWGLTTGRCLGGGVSRARNTALTLAQHDIVVFADDDVVLDREAVIRLADAVERTGATVVTGRVIPQATAQPKIDTVFRDYLGFDRGTEPRIWRRPGPLSPFAVWDIGVGALFAVDRRQITPQSHVRFDERLSNGRFCGGTEDVDFFMQAYRAGLTVAYEPAAIAHHQFPTDWASIGQKCRQYALSDGAFYAKWHRDSTIADYIGEVRGWIRRLGHHVRRATRQQAAVPITALLIEPPLKLVGATYWFTRRSGEPAARHRSTESGRTRSRWPWRNALIRAADHGREHHNSSQFDPQRPRRPVAEGE